MLINVPQVVNNNNPDENSPTAILSTLDLIEHMLCHHQEQALGLVERALWHEHQAKALESERRALAADVTEVLRQAEADRLPR